jgi:hypothetical protein
MSGAAMTDSRSVIVAGAGPHLGGVSMTRHS